MPEDAVYDYRTPVNAWPYWVRVRWPNTIVTIRMIARFAAPDQAVTARMR